ncbi:MAG: membrane protein insertion efficiency factor YidD [Bacteroidetes bacterium]|nr:membrane protein insertion efficiency factor YidD [Bacteroidota bacterium]
MLSRIFIFLLLPLSVSGQPITEGWEPGESLPAFSDSSVFNPGIALVKFYQAQIGPNSVTRCPYYTSCSNFTLNAIRKYGVLTGFAFFIDRAWYREHDSMYFYYSLRVRQDGILKLDDEGYLTY